MSNYREFIQDFPSRCRDVVLAFSRDAKEQNREVTLLLMATAAGFVMPYERLSEGSSIKQPPLDRPRFNEAMKQLKHFLAEPMAESRLFDRGSSLWRGGPLESADGTPDDWPECHDPQKLPPETPVSDAISWLRHSLAHGNVFTRGGRGDQISELIFVCGGTLRNGKQIPLRFLLLSPVELHEFLDRWFTFVTELKLPHHAVLEIVDEAA